MINIAQSWITWTLALGLLAAVVLVGLGTGGLGLLLVVPLALLFDVGLLRGIRALWRRLTGTSNV